VGDVFLSYAREDRARAEQVARGLEAAGVQVFWDNEIPPGQTWADYIETKLTQCRALIVLWSAESTKSQWVREEARMGRDKGVLIPAMIDNVQAPFGFGEVQAANLSSWTGDANHPDWRRFVEAVRGAQSREPTPRPMASEPPRVQPAMSAPSIEAPKKKGVPAWVWVVGGVVGIVVLLGIIGTMAPDTSTTPPIQSAASTVPVDTPPATQAPVQNAAVYQQQIADRLSQVAQAAASEGFSQISAPHSGQLRQGETLTVPVTMNTGGEYRIIGVCDADCGDLDLTLLDGYGNAISTDTTTTAMPVVSVIPTTSGQFNVQVLMYNCAHEPCFYALSLYGRPQ